MNQPVFSRVQPLSQAFAVNTESHLQPVLCSACFEETEASVVSWEGVFVRFLPGFDLHILGPRASL